MYPRQRQATLRGHGGVCSSSDSQRRASTHADPHPGFSAPVARLSKWPKNVFFASDFIAEKVAAASSTNARRRGSHRLARSTEKPESGPRAVIGGHKPTARHRTSKKTATCRSSDGRRAVPQSIQRPTERQESRPDAVRGEEGGTFLEESASALLLLHSRFFVGVRQEDDIVCRLCMLCREAGWMGNPLRVSPNLDPLVLENMIVARLQRSDRCDLVWQHNGASGHSKTKLSSSEEVFSFETFYRILADIAMLIYPREGKAMKKLLLEGVLPLAADSAPRIWSPRPELLYGRPALAALRMQRGTLHQLYCTYESGSGGIGRTVFLKMLAGLGVTPVSVSEQHAASVFDDALRNGLAGAQPPFACKEQRLREESRAAHLADESRDDYLGLGIFGRVSSSSRKPLGDRLCWSTFLEAMATLAVGAVKEGHAKATVKDRNRTPVPKPGNRKNAGLIRNFGEPGDDGCEATRHACSPGENRYPKRRVSSRSDGESGCTYQDEAGEKVGKTQSQRPRAAPWAGGNGRAHSFLERENRQTCGRGFYHDSRREVELMPTLRETDAPSEHARSPVRCRPPSPLQQTPQGQEDVTTKLIIEPTDTCRTANQLSATKFATRTGRGNTARPTLFGDTKSGLLQYPDDQELGTMELECSMMEHRPAVTKSTRYGLSGRKLRAEETTLSGASHDENVSVERCRSTETDHCRVRARVAGETKETMDRAVTFDEPLSSRFTIISNGGACQATSSVVRPNVSLLEAVTKDAGDEVLRGQDLVSLSKRRGTFAARDVIASTANTSADVRPLIVSVPLEWDGTGRRADGGLSPAPCHGGSLLAVQVPSSTTPAGSEGLKGSLCDASDHLGEQVAQTPLFPGLGVHAGTSLHLPIPRPTNLVTGTSSGGGGVKNPSTIGTPPGARAESGRDKHSTLRTDQKTVQEEEVRPSWGERDGRKCKEGLDGSGSLPLSEDCGERSKEGFGREKDVNDVTMNVEAAGATIFGELLEPRVVAVYSRHRKDLLTLYQRYRSVGADGEQFKYVGDAGIWRFVGEFPILARWADHDSILRLIVRASRDRGWHRCGVEGEEPPAGQPSAFTYVGFLELLTRMAYCTMPSGEWFLASQCRSPLYRKLLAFISALKINDPRGILR